MQTFKKHWIKLAATLALSGLAATLSHKLSASEGLSAERIDNSQSKLIAQTADVAPSSSTAMPTYTVVACNDGDTCRLRAADNTQIKVRLVGIDAPEMGKKSKKKKKEGQSGGKEAKEFLNNLVVGKTVTLKSYGADAYGRNLAEIMVNNESANLKMVNEGWAEVYRGKSPRGLDTAAYQNAQTEAKKNGKGIWSLADYESPKEFRKKNRD
jgi:micrococcal nuclease